MTPAPIYAGSRVVCANCGAPAFDVLEHIFPGEFISGGRLHPLRGRMEEMNCPECGASDGLAKVVRRHGDFVISLHTGQGWS